MSKPHISMRIFLTCLLSIPSFLPAFAAVVGAPKAGVSAGSSASAAGASLLDGRSVLGAEASPAAAAVAGILPSIAAVELSASVAARLRAAEAVLRGEASERGALEGADSVAGRILSEKSVLEDAALRAELAVRLGEDAVARLEFVRDRLDSAAASRPDVARWLVRMRGEEGRNLDAEGARSSVEKVSAGIEGWKNRTESAVKPTWRERARRAASMFLIAGLLSGQGLPALAQNADTPGLAQGPGISKVIEVAQAQTQEGAYVRARDISGVISSWKAGARLYVVGDVGLGDATLKKLEGWLAGKHWTVVLMADASGSRYTDAEGRTHRDLDAVEFATGQGIPHKDGFDGQINAKTGEADGAVLTIVMGQRALFYSASKAQDSRSLGESEFISPSKNNPTKLDRWAISSLRAGGDVVGAVKDTVTHIDGLLARAVASEVESAQGKIVSAKSRLAELKSAADRFVKAHPAAAGRLAAVDFSSLNRDIAAAENAYAAKRAVESARITAAVLSQIDARLSAITGFNDSFSAASRDIAAAESELGSLKKEAASFREKYSKAGGEIANPATVGMAESLRRAGSLLETGPAAAQSAAKDVRARIASAMEAIRLYPAAQQLIGNAETRLKSARADEYASSAAGELVAAGQQLAEARERYEQGHPDYAARLKTAKSSLSEAERVISAAGAAAARNAAIFWGLIALVTLGLGLGLFFLNRTARLWRRKATDQLARWRTALDEKLETQLEDLDQRVDIWLGAAHGAEKKRYVGKTKEFAVQAREDVGTLSILWDMARDTLDRAEGLVNAEGFGKVANWLSTKKYKEALDLLDEENGAKVAFDPGDEEALRRIFGEKIDKRERLYGKLSEFTRFEKSLGELLEEYNERARRADEILGGIQTAVESARPMMESISASLTSTQEKAAAIAKAGEEDGLFLLPSLAGALLPAAAEALAKTKAGVTSDPIGTLETSGARAQRMANEAAALSDAVLAARSAIFPRVDAAAVAMRASGIETEWVDEGLSTLSGRAEALAARARESGTAPAIVKFSEALEAFAAKTEKAAALTKTLDAAREKKIAGVVETVAAARAELGEALGLSTNKILVEEGSNPSVFLKEASAQAETMAGHLGRGGIEDAETAFAQLSSLSSAAAAIVQASREALASHSATVSERRTETSRLTGLLPEHEQVLERIRSTYAESVLALTAGDATHPNANGTVDDNIAEIREDLAASNEKLNRALAAHRAGRLLEAAGLLAQIAAHQDTIRRRYQEITDKERRLAETVAANAGKLGELSGRVRDYASSIREDRRYMKSTFRQMELIEAEFAAARELVEARKGDPFVAAQRLKFLQDGLDQLHVSMRNDLDLFTEAERSLQEAASQIGTAESWARKAEGDGIADSSEIEQAYAGLRELQAALAKAERSLAADRGDWGRVDEAADLIAAEAARSAAALKREIAEGEAAVSAVSRAASKVREAAGWSGSYGVYISGAPGSGELNSARSALERGDYDAAAGYAQRAYREADSAIDAAEAEVARRRRAEEERRRREEEERRRRAREEEARRRSSSGGGGSGWGGSSSGAARSGW